MHDPDTRKVIVSRDVKFCEKNFDNISHPGEDIKEERISAHHNFEKEFHVIYPEIDDTVETDIDNLQGHEPVGETEKPKTIR